MKKALKISLAALSAAAVCAGGAFFASAQADIYEMPATYAAVLKQGARGGEVKEVQRRLKNWGYYSGKLDGIYGSEWNKHDGRKDRCGACVDFFNRHDGLRKKYSGPASCSASWMGVLRC